METIWEVYNIGVSSSYFVSSFWLRRRDPYRLYYSVMHTNFLLFRIFTASSTHERVIVGVIGLGDIDFSCLVQYGGARGLMNRGCDFD